MKKIIALLPTAFAILSAVGALLGARHQFIIAIMYGILALFAWRWALTEKTK